MTSAPSAARYLVQIGPAITQLKSTIRTPSRGRVEGTSPPNPLSGADRGRRGGRVGSSVELIGGWGAGRLEWTPDWVGCWKPAPTECPPFVAAAIRASS